NHATGGDGGAGAVAGQAGGAGGHAKGGGIFNSGTLTLTNTTVNGSNSATGGKGGNSDTTTGNGGNGLGGGVYTLDTLTLTLNNSTIASNSATGGTAGVGGGTGGGTGSGSGGGIYNDAVSAAATASITNSTISGNTASLNGGGIYNNAVSAAATASITNSTISGNTASLNGGGIYNTGVTSSATLTLTNSTISGNTANNDGGGIYNSGAMATATLTSVTVTNNTADNDNNVSGAGGGIKVASGTLTLKNTIVAGNFNKSTSPTADDIAGAVDGTSSFNLIGIDTGMTGISNGSQNNQVGTGTPIDAKLGALADNGGPTKTHALLYVSAVDFSPALEKGNKFGLTTDQRGFSRTVDFDSTAPIAPYDDTDIGAFELQLIPPTIAKAFSPTAIQSGGTSTVTLTLTNPNTSPLSNASFTDMLANMSVNATGPAGGTCVGANGNNLTAGQTALSFSGITIPANSVTCTVTFVVTSSTVGTNPNSTSGVTTTQTTTAGPVSNTANLSVFAPPTIAKAFSPDKIQTGGTSTVTLTLTNPNASPLTNASFTDTLVNMSVNATGAAGGTCVGANSNNLTAGQTALSFSGINATSGVATTQTTTAGPASNTANLSVFAPPTVLSITRFDPNPTNLQTVHFTVTFSKAVTGVNIGANSDFTLTTTGIAGASITGLSGSGTTYTVTVDTGTGDGTVRLNVVDDDSIMSTDALVLPLGGTGVGNGNFSTGEVYTVSKSDPSVVSITRVEANPTNLGSVHYTVNFSKPVTGVDTTDFTPTAVGLTGTPMVTGVTPVDSSHYTVTVSTGTGTTGAGAHTLRLDVTDDDTIIDSGNRPLGGPGAGNGNFTAGQVYDIDKTPPIATIEQAAGQFDPVTGPTATTVINFKVTLSETLTTASAIGSFSNSDISLSGTAGATVANITGSGPIYNVAIEGMTQTGTVIININAGVFQDDAGNLNSASTIVDNTVTFNVDNFSTFEVNSTADPGDGVCDPIGTGSRL
ncbi:MAG: hypothetical protein DMF75_03040, partial [Acidobacteria bacterium]